MGRKGRRLTREHWAGAALEALAEGGVPAVAVEPIARRLGVTKGSFYHHFSNRDELLQAALERWEAFGTDAILREFAALDTPRERVHRLLQTAFELVSAGKSGLLLVHLASSEHELIGPVMARVTARRLDFIARSLTDGGLSEEVARQRALMAYSTYLGTFQLLASAPEQVPKGEALTRYIDHMVSILLPEDQL